MMVNQNDEQVFEDYILWGSDFTDPGELGEALLLLADQLGCRFVRTNATKHGTIELQLLPSDKEEP